VRFGRDELSANLEILDSAINSAVSCPFKNPDRVYEVLQAVNSVAERWKTSLETKSSMGGGLVEAFRLKGLDFKKDISQRAEQDSRMTIVSYIRDPDASLNSTLLKGLETQTRVFRSTCSSTRTQKKWSLPM
jgi:hypothetical protein